LIAALKKWQTQETKDIFLANTTPLITWRDSWQRWLLDHRVISSWTRAAEMEGSWKLL
jgi:hypothetical protein